MLPPTHCSPPRSNPNRLRALLRQVGLIHRGRIYNPAGRYHGTLDEDCIVDRIDDRPRQIAPFTPAVILLPETLDELADTLARQ